MSSSKSTGGRCACRGPSSRPPRSVPASGRSWRDCGAPARPPPGPHPLLAALWLAVADQLGHLVLKAPPLLLIAGVLHRREIALHLAILVAIDLLQRELVLLPRGHQLLHAVFVGRSRGQLGVQGLVDLALPRAHRLALLLEPLLGGLHLPCLVVAQTQRRAHMLVPALPDLATQLLRLRRVRVGERARVALLLRPERRRQRDHEHPPEPPHHPSRDRSSSRNWGAVRSSRLASGG